MQKKKQGASQTAKKWQKITKIRLKKRTDTKKCKNKKTGSQQKAKKNKKKTKNNSTHWAGQFWAPENSRVGNTARIQLKLLIGPKTNKLPPKQAICPKNAPKMHKKTQKKGWNGWKKSPPVQGGPLPRSPKLVETTANGSPPNTGKYSTVWVLFLGA